MRGGRGGSRRPAWSPNTIQRGPRVGTRSNPGASCSRFSEVGGPGGSSSRKKSDSRERARNHTQCRAEGTSRAPKQQSRPGCTDSVTSRLFPRGSESRTLEMEAPRGLVSEASWEDGAEGLPTKSPRGCEKRSPPHGTCQPATPYLTQLQLLDEDRRLSPKCLVHRRQ